MYFILILLDSIYGNILMTLEDIILPIQIGKKRIGMFLCMQNNIVNNTNIVLDWYKWLIHTRTLTVTQSCNEGLTKVTAQCFTTMDFGIQGNVNTHGSDMA